MDYRQQKKRKIDKQNLFYLLVKAKANDHILDSLNNKKVTLDDVNIGLRKAAFDGDSDIVKIILENTYNGYKNFNPMRGLISAIKGGSIQVVIELLTDRRSYVERYINIFQDAIEQAAEKDLHQIIDYMLTYDTAEYGFGQLALETAVAHGNINSIYVILNHPFSDIDVAVMYELIKRLTNILKKTPLDEDEQIIILKILRLLVQNHRVDWRRIIQNTYVVEDVKNLLKKRLHMIILTMKKQLAPTVIMPKDIQKKIIIQTLFSELCGTVSEREKLKLIGLGLNESDLDNLDKLKYNESNSNTVLPSIYLVIFSKIIGIKVDNNSTKLELCNSIANMLAYRPDPLPSVYVPNDDTQQAYHTYQQKTKRK